VSVVLTDEMMKAVILVGCFIVDDLSYDLLLMMKYAVIRE